MYHPRPPLKALLPARRAADEESPVQASDSIPDYYPERLDSRQHLIVRLFSLLLQERPSLPTSIDSRISRPPLRNTITLGRRAEISRHNRAHTRLPTLIQANNDVSMVNERTEQGAEDGEGVNTSFYASTPHTFDNRTRHKKRIEELKKYIMPISPEDGSAVVLLCWGEKSSCSILPVSISDPEDEVATWREINAAWYACKGHWMKKILGFIVTRVSIAEIILLGLKEAPSGFGTGKYVGMYLEQDIPTERRRLQQIINSNPPILDCFYSRETGTVQCCDLDCFCSECVPNIDGIDDCPVKKLLAARRELLLLDTLDLMRHVFSNPVLAASNDFLEKGNLIHSHQKVLNQFHIWYDWHRPGLREIPFRGILINEGWVLGTQQVVLPLMATMFLAVVIAARFLFDWNTAWSVGSFFVALATLLWIAR
ncbi:hypothetical protein BDV12DRAFT_205888 [Aspergillus spectabilis]